MLYNFTTRDKHVVLNCYKKSLIAPLSCLKEAMDSRSDASGDEKGDLYKQGLMGNGALAKCKRIQTIHSDRDFIEAYARLCYCSQV